MKRNLSHAVGDYLTENLRRNLVQCRNPITDRWTKLSTRNGRIVAVKKTKGAYRHVAKFEDWLVSRGF